MKHSKMDPEKAFLPYYRAVEKGDLQAAKYLMIFAIDTLDQGKLLPARLNNFFLKTIKDPDKFSVIMKFKPKKKRGPVSIDDSNILSIAGLGTLGIFGILPSERNALAIHYLISEGHTLNVAGNDKKESAVGILYELTGRSCRSLQADYAKHKNKILKNNSSLDSGKLEYLRYLRLAELRDSRSA